MKHIFFNKQCLLLVFSALMILTATTGCIRESLEACPPANTYKLTLKVQNKDGDDITESGDVKSVKLYIFDKQKGFVETREMSGEDIKTHQPIVLDYPGTPDNMYVVAWAGLEEGQVNVANVNNGSLAEDLNVTLRTANGIADTPNELYHGMAFVERAENALTKDQEVIIVPKIGRMSIEAYGLEYVGLKSANSTDEQFSYTISKTQSGFDYTGTMIGDLVEYLPPAEFQNIENQNVFATENYNTMPRANQDMTVTLYKYKGQETKGLSLNLLRAGAIDGQWMQSMDAYENPIVVNPGENTLVVFIFQKSDDPVPDDPTDPDDPDNPNDPDTPDNPDTPDPDDPNPPTPPTPPAPNPTPDPNIVFYVYSRVVDWNYVHEDHVLTGGEDVKLKSSRKLK